MKFSLDECQNKIDLIETISCNDSNLFLIIFYFESKRSHVIRIHAIFQHIIIRSYFDTLANIKTQLFYDCEKRTISIFHKRRLRNLQFSHTKQNEKADCETARIFLLIWNFINEKCTAAEISIFKTVVGFFADFERLRQPSVGQA